MELLKAIVRSALRPFRYEIKRIPAPSPLGLSIDADMKWLGHPGRMIFDVGANRGQSIQAFKVLWPDCEIHAFEPDENAAADAGKVAAAFRNVVLNKIALGDRVGFTGFREYDHSNMSSLLLPARHSWAKPIRETLVPVTTIDAYCENRRIERIDVLKIDAQGTDDAVLRGAEGMLRDGRITLVRTELTFAALYERQFAPLESLAWMLGRGYRIVSFYDQTFFHDGLGWMDVLYRRDNLATRATEAAGEAAPVARLVAVGSGGAR